MFYRHEQERYTSRYTMIKAEVIIHEGTPGANWLDHCRTLVTPGRLTLIAVSAIALITTAAMMHKSPGASQPITTSTQPVSSGLSVQPLSSATPAAQSAAATIQAANGGAANTGSQQDNSAASLGAASAPAGGNGNNKVDQTKLNGANLTNNVQTTVRDAHTDVNKSFNALTHKLGE